MAKIPPFDERNPNNPHFQPSKPEKLTIEHKNIGETSIFPGETNIFMHLSHSFPMVFRDFWSFFGTGPPSTRLRQGQLGTRVQGAALHAEAEAAEGTQPSEMGRKSMAYLLMFNPWGSMV